MFHKLQAKATPYINSYVYKNQDVHKGKSNKRLHHKTAMCYIISLLSKIYNGTELLSFCKLISRTSKWY